MALLESEILRLRAPEPEDIDLLYNWENDPDIWRVSNTLTPFSRYVLKEYLAHAHEDIFTQKQLRLIIESREPEGTALGAVDLFDFDPYHKRAGVGILIHNTDQRNRGIASGALRLMQEYAFDHLNLHQLYCNITEDNQGSIRLFEKAGFRKIAEKKDWIWTSNGWLTEYTYQKINHRNDPK